MTADDIECRIAEVDKNGKYVSLLLYKTARTDAQLLDETYGPFDWQNDYKVIDGKMYCGIGIINNNGEWVWKWNCGTESNTEAEKGQASDALKRAGFVWGIGTELYSAPRILIWPDKCNIDDAGGKKRCYDTFRVSRIEYDNRQNISALEIFNEKKRCVAFVWPDKKAQANNTTASKETTHAACKPQNPAPASEQELPPPSEDGYYYCEKCKKVVSRVKSTDGAFLTPMEVAKISYKRSKHILCADCLKGLVELT